MVKSDRWLSVPQCEAITRRGLRCQRASEYDDEVDGRLVRLCAVHHKHVRRDGVTLVAVDGGVADTARAAGEG